jgi:hypothetical protein
VRLCQSSGRSCTARTGLGRNQFAFGERSARTQEVGSLAPFCGLGQWNLRLHASVRRHRRALRGCLWPCVGRIRLHAAAPYALMNKRHHRPVNAYSPGSTLSSRSVPPTLRCDPDSGGSLSHRMSQTWRRRRRGPSGSWARRSGTRRSSRRPSREQTEPGEATRPNRMARPRATALRRQRCERLLSQR